MSVEQAAKTIEAALDLPIRYIDRSRAYYLALGYDNPYRWAHNKDVPFTALSKHTDVPLAPITSVVFTGRLRASAAMSGLLA